MRTLAIVVAGGRGTRMGASVPKQFLPLGGVSILRRTLHVWLHRPSTRVVLVLPAGETFAADSERVELATGGDTRWASVRAGLQLWRDEQLVAVHDAVRPLVTPDTIDRTEAAALAHGAATPALRPIESVRIATGDKCSDTRAIDRGRVWLVQTPQIFQADVLRHAYQRPFSPLFTDDCSVVEADGHGITIVEGNAENIKITTPDDLRRAEQLLRDLRAAGRLT